MSALDPGLGIRRRPREGSRRFRPACPTTVSTRAGRPGTWRPVVGVLLMLGTLLVGVGIVAIIPFVFWYVATGADCSRR